MKREMILPVLLSFGISLALGPVLIPFLRKVKAGQKEREEGVPSHQKKAGTPTMGGVMFLAAFTASFPPFPERGSGSGSGAVSDAWFWPDRLSR